MVSQLDRPAGSAVTKRSAALTATLIALPVALAAWLGLVWWSGGFAGDTKANPSPSAIASGPVAVGLPGTVDKRTESLCRALLAQLPKALAGRALGRPVTPASAVERAAAWGDPAIVLRCGVGAPYVASGTARVLSINGIDWVETKSGADSVCRVSGRQVAIELDVPEKYATGAGGALLLPLAAPISAAVPVAG